MTDFSHLHALEERAVRIRERMIDVQKNDAQWKAQAVQLFQTEKEIADEREFLGLEDMSADDLYAALFEEAESEVVREITKELNAAEPGAIVFKHDPYCDCGICQYCRGDEDKFGNLTKNGERETDALTDAIKRMLILECSECDEARTENLKSVLLHACVLETRQFAKTAWKYGWIVETGKVLCPNCRADEEEWRSI